MEIRQLRYFLNAAKTLNFTKAAQISFVAQSTLSQQIKELEYSLKTTLFDRVGKKVLLTKEGEAFLPFAKKIIDDIDDGKQRILDLQELKDGNIKIGIAYGLTYLLTSALSLFCHQYPNVHIEILYRSSDDLTNMIANRDIDIALTFNRPLETDEISEEHLFKTGLYVVVDKTHKLAKLDKISICDLKDYPLVLPPKGMSSRNSFDYLQDKYNVHFKSQVEINEFYTLLQLVKTRCWISVLAEAVIFDEPELTIIPFKEECVFMQANLLTLKDVYQSKAVEEFIKTLRSCLIGDE